MTERRLRILLIIFSMVALLNALYLAYLGVNARVECVIGSSCNHIVASSYGKFLGIPVSIYAIGFYLSILVLALGKEDMVTRTRWVYGFAWIGAHISAWFTFVQIFLLTGFCLFCFLNFVLAVGMAIAADRLWAKIRHDATFWNLDGAFKTVALTFAISFLLPLLGYGLFEFGRTLPTSQRDNPVVARIRGVEVTLEALDARVTGDLRDLEEQRRKLRHEALELIVLERAASREGMTVGRFIEEGLGDLPEITDERLESFYEENSDNFPPDMSEEEKREYCRTALQQRDRRLSYHSFVQQTFATEGVKPEIPRPELVQLPRPQPDTFTVGDPASPIRIVEFSDFQCAACAVAHGKITQLLNGPLADQIYFEFRHFPLDQHSQAEPAARAAICAGRQGQFSAAADFLFQNQKKWSIGNVIDLVAEHLDLDDATYRFCVKDSGVTTTIQEDIEAGSRLGLDAIPSFFLNGRYVSGVPDEADLRAILLKDY